MIYDLSKIMSVTDCDAYIGEAQLERSNLQRAITRYVTYATVRASVESRTEMLLVAVNARIAVLEADIITKPEGSSDRKKLEKQLHKEQERKIGYELTLGEDHTKLEVSRQFLQGDAEAMVTNLDARIVALETRKVELQNAA